VQATPKMQQQQQKHVATRKPYVHDSQFPLQPVTQSWYCVLHRYWYRYFV